MRLLVGLLIVLAGLFFGKSWLTKSDERKAAGILPLSAAGMMVDESGQPAPISRVLKSFLVAWPIYLSSICIVLGAVLIYSAA